MAKKKVKTSPQLEYTKYYKAMKVLSKYDDRIPEPKELKRATKKSVANIKKEYKKGRRIFKEEDIDIPSLKELQKYYDERQTIPPTETIDYGEEFVDGFREHITRVYYDSVEAISNPKVQAYWKDKSEPLIKEALSMLDSIIETANYNYELVADKIKAQPDYDILMSTDYIGPSNLEQYGETCVQFFTSVMIDIMSDIGG